MEKLNIWSDEKPTKPGWYWYRDKNIKTASIVFIPSVSLIITADGFQWSFIPEPKEEE